MNKQEFIKKLKEMLSDLPEKEINERIEFYSEMIDDRIEDGLTEEQAIKDIGTVEDVAKQIIDEIPLFKIIKHKLKKSKNKTKNQNTTVKRKKSWWEITLLAVGSPVWLSLLISFFAVILSLYISLWAVVISFYAADLSLLLSGFAVLAGIVFIFTDGLSVGLLIIAGGLICIGISIIFFYVCKYTAKFAIFITKKLARLIKNSFIRREQI